jgi:hypothetical protein
MFPVCSQKESRTVWLLTAGIAQTRLTPMLRLAFTL